MSMHQMPSNLDDPNLEKALRKAFRRQEAPEGFADRVMARIPAQGRRLSAWRRDWLAIAASSCIAVLGFGAWQQHQRQVEGEQAKQELIYALTVASESLQKTRILVER